MSVNVFSDLNLNKKDSIYLLILFVFSLLITINLVLFNAKVGIFSSDVYVYLTNSLTYAGLNTNHIGDLHNMFLSPVICYLTSILFRLGVNKIISLFIITGCFGILCNIAMYVLLRNRFNSLLSLTGSMLFGSLSLTLFWWANGTLDIPAIGLSIWAMIFTIIAVDKNPKYYLLALPIFVVAVFTRYTALFMLPLMFLYFLSKHDFFDWVDCFISDRDLFKKLLFDFFKSSEFKYIIISIIIAAIVSLLFIGIILSYGGSLTFVTQSADSITGFKAHTKDRHYNGSRLFYIKNFLAYLYATKIKHPNFIGVNYLSYLVSAILGLGVLLKLGSVVKNIKPLTSQRLSFKTKNFRKILIVLLLVLIVVAAIGFLKSFMISDIALLTGFVVLFALLNKYPIDKKHTNLNILFLAWFLVYFVFFSFLNIKLNRYILTAMPAFVYFVIYALEYIFKVLNNGFEDFSKANEEKPVKKSSFKSKLSYIVPIVLIILFIFASVNFTSTVAYSKGHHVEDVSNFLMHHDPDYNEKVIMADSSRFYSWYLNVNVLSHKGVDEESVESSNVTYLITFDKLKHKDTFHQIYKSAGYHVYERK